MSQPESKEFQAPDGTYGMLSLISDTYKGSLGNAYTKRFVGFDQTSDSIGSLRVHIKIRSTMRIGRFNYTYQFTINEGDQVTMGDASRERRVAGEPLETIQPPSLETLLREISRAEKVQPSLKR